MAGERIRVRGTVQGVGFRPLVARLARAQGLAGAVRNDGEGVTIALQAERPAVDAFIAALLAGLPPLARVQSLEREVDDSFTARTFEIEASAPSSARTDVAPDAAPCAACVAEFKSPYERRYRYPFTNCTHCGPRYSILEKLPYDRAATTLSGFALCAACAAEYGDESDRRYHAQPIACHVCGPKAWLERTDGRAFSFDRYSSLDHVDAAAGLLLEGQIVAVKGVGGFQLLADATRPDVVRRLRERKHRDAKPFALMVRDLEVAQRFARMLPEEREALASPAAPIVLVEKGQSAVADGVAPGMGTLGVMLPASPLHHLLMRRLDRPVVCTSGNQSDEPPCLTEEQARAQLGGTAEWLLLHDRPIARRVDDSVQRRMDGALRTLRRARGLVPAPIAAPKGFEGAPTVLALGGQFKATVCVLAEGRAVLSPHLGDLDHAAAFSEWQRSVELLEALYPQRPSAIAVDAHPEYRATEVGHNLARARGVERFDVLHHHAHLAACLFENGHPLDGAEVLGIALDGLGAGEGGALWGGEFLAASYRGVRRLGTFRPVPLLGGDAASREPWRNLWAHLRARMSWAELEVNYGETALLGRLREKPRELLEQVLQDPRLSPPASSAGRLFDAVAAAVGVGFERVSFEGEAAMQLEALATPELVQQAQAEELYPMGIPLLGGKGLPYLEPEWTWRAILGDVHAGESPARISARFHVALADGIVRMALKLRGAEPALTRVALSGGVWQNKVLLELVATALRGHGFELFTHREVPPNDGGVSLGQAAVAAAQLLHRRS